MIGRGEPGLFVHSSEHRPDHSPLTNLSPVPSLPCTQHLDQHFKIFEAAPQESRQVPSRNPTPDYFL
jgi:hypothetical protein